MTLEVKSDISYQLYDLDYLCSHVRLDSKCSYWLNLARKCLVAASEAEDEAKVFSDLGGLQTALEVKC